MIGRAVLPRMKLMLRSNRSSTCNLSYHHHYHRSFRSTAKRLAEKDTTLERKKFHQEMEQMFGNSSSSSSRSTASTTSAATAATTTTTTTQQQAEKVRKARYQQSLINAGVSFFTVLLAAQALKSAHEKRKKELELQVVVDLLEQKRQLLNDLVQEDALRDLARKCAGAVAALEEDSGGDAFNKKKNNVAKPKGSWWWGAGEADLFDDHDDNDSNTSRQLEDAMYRVLHQELNRRVGAAGLNEAEQDKLVLNQLLHEDDDELNSDGMKQLMNELSTESAVVEDDGNKKVIKKQIFRI